VWRRVRKGGCRRHWSGRRLREAKIASSPIATTRRIEHRSLGGEKRRAITRAAIKTIAAMIPR
jgi:hypothetical protein